MFESRLNRPIFWSQLVIHWVSPRLWLPQMYGYNRLWGSDLPTPREWLRWLRHACSRGQHLQGA